MQMNIMELIKNGKIGDALKTRGGQRYRYNRYIFIKAKKNTVYVYEGYSYSTIKSRMDSKPIESRVCTLTPDKVTFKLKLWNPEAKGNWRKTTYKVDAIAGFLSFNFLFKCYVSWSHNQTLIHTNNGVVTPFAKMEFDWRGNLLSKIPVYAQKKYNEWDKYAKDKRNRAARARYANKKAERIFYKHEKEGTLNEYPVKDVFKIHNAQIRSYAMNAIGMDKVLKPYPNRVIDTEIIEGQGKYELVDIELPSITVVRWGEKVKSEPKWCLYLKMVNQSTGEYHLEGIPRKSDDWNNHIPEETVRGALAWRDGEVPRTNWNDTVDRKEWDYVEPTILT